MSRISDDADESHTYFCGWAITGRTSMAHLVASSRFPLAGYQYRTWCGQVVTVVGLTLTRADCHKPAPCATTNSEFSLPTSNPNLMYQ